MNFLRTGLTLVLAALLLSGCVRVYKIDIQQGNDLTADQVQSIQLGMTQNQVRSALGTPLLDDPFHADRWDYFYTMREGRSRKVERRSLSLFFTEGQLARVVGGIDPEEVKASRVDLEKLDSKLNKSKKKNERNVAKEEEDDDKPGFWARLKGSINKDDEAE